MLQSIFYNIFILPLYSRGIRTNSFVGGYHIYIYMMYKMLLINVINKINHHTYFTYREGVKFPRSVCHCIIVIYFHVIVMW